MQSIEFKRGPVNPMAARAERLDGAGSVERLARSPYFAVERLRLSGATTIGHPDRFTILIGVAGACEVVHDGRPVRLDFGQTLLLPAAIGACRIVPQGDAVVLSCVVP
jgi:mannose-6-phosphate isomerase